MNPVSTEIVDAYAHCGISKYLPVENVRAVMHSAGVSRAVLVQHLGEFDNAYLEGVVRDDPQHFAGVCLIDHGRPTAVDDLRRIAAAGIFRGVRLTAEAITQCPDLLTAAAESGLIVVLYVPGGVVSAIEPLKRHLTAHPSAELVISHFGEPAIKNGKLDERAYSVLELGSFANAYLQLSGMPMFCPPPHRPLYPLIERALDSFGPARIVWGSNFPVGGGPAEYQGDLRLLLDGELPIPRADAHRIAGKNAKRLWFPTSD